VSHITYSNILWHTSLTVTFGVTHRLHFVSHISYNNLLLVWSLSVVSSVYTMPKVKFRPTDVMLRKAVVITRTHKTQLDFTAMCFVFYWNVSVT